MLFKYHGHLYVGCSRVGNRKNLVINVYIYIYIYTRVFVFMFVCYIWIYCLASLSVFTNGSSVCVCVCVCVRVCVFVRFCLRIFCLFNVHMVNMLVGRFLLRNIVL